MSLVRRSGFTAIEILLVLGVVGASSGFSMPLYRSYIARSDLEIARQNIAQGLERARFLSQVAMNDSGWGFSTNAVPGRGVLYMGSTYASRDTDFDELYTISPSITLSGLKEVNFTKIDGLPDVTGQIVLTSSIGEVRTIDVGHSGEVTIPEDWLTICLDPYGVNPVTLQAPDSLWEYYEDQGATLGACTSGLESGGSGGTGSGNVTFTITDKAVIPSEAYTCQISVLGAAISSSGDYDMPVTLQVKENGTLRDTFGDWLQPVSSNLNDGVVHNADCTESSITANTPLHIKARSWQKKYFWYSGLVNWHWRNSMTINTENVSANVEVLKDGDNIPSYEPLNNQATIESFLNDYIDVDAGTMAMGEGQVIYLFELGTSNLNSSAADFQDLVLLVTLQES